MTTPSSSSNPFYNSSTLNSTNSLNGSSSRMALDNLLRRELKVTDPNDSGQVAQALLARYKDTPKAVAISREAQGVPFLLTPATQMAVPQATTSSDAELRQAIDDVERDFQELTTNAILKDITLELQGWQVALRSAITEGASSARFALDPRQRDKTFGIRRTLGDYARVSRLVGALTPSLTVNYRKLAQSLDEVAAVLLVMMGEALANVGFNGSRYLLQAPYGELQIRRDAVITSLRNLIGSAQESYDQNQWPRGLNAYRKLFEYLEQNGQGDLRALLVENELIRIMDALIQRAGHGRAEGLRALGATAQLDIERFRRLVIVGRRAVTRSAPPLTAFLEALQFFIDGFESSGGFRLLRIARPPILFYGLYGIAGLDPADQRLLELAILRNNLAEQLDCFAQCGCDPETVKCQILLDKILYDVDRAIDLYSLGNDDFGEPEKRAAAYSYLIEKFIDANANNLQCDLSLPSQVPGVTLETILNNIQTKLRHLGLNPTSSLKAAMKTSYIQELFVQKDMEKSWQNLVKSMAPACVTFSNRTNIEDPATGTGIFDKIESTINAALLKLLPSGTKVTDLDNLNPDLQLPQVFDVSL
jgi:hypothetical protein